MTVFLGEKYSISSLITDRDYIGYTLETRTCSHIAQLRQDTRSFFRFGVLQVGKIEGKKMFHTVYKKLLQVKPVHSYDTTPHTKTSRHDTRQTTHTTTISNCDEVGNDSNEYLSARETSPRS